MSEEQSKTTADDPQMPVYDAEKKAFQYMGRWFTVHGMIAVMEHSPERAVDSVPGHLVVSDPEGVHIVVAHLRPVTQLNTMQERIVKTMHDMAVFAVLNKLPRPPADLSAGA